MKTDLFVKTLLILITVFLGLIALRPLLTPQIVQAESEGEHNFYIEPGTAILNSPDGTQNVVGKVVVDLTTGKIWGFPTQRPEPYPRAFTTGQAPVVTPFYLGRYDLSAMTR